MSLFIEKIGSGAPLVLLHGWGLHGGVWQPLVKSLSRHYSLHIVDLPGMGYSSPIDAPADTSLLQAVAQHLLNELPPDVDVVGWSLGGLIAMQMALLKPQQIRRMILVGSTPCFVSKPDWVDGVSAAVFQKFAADIGADYKNTLMRFLTLQCMGEKTGWRTTRQLRESFEKRPTPTLTSLQKALSLLLDNDLRTQVPQINARTLIIHGDRDTLAPLPAAQWLATHLPNAQLRVISGASHAPFLSHGEQFIAALEQFLTGAAAAN